MPSLSVPCCVLALHRALALVLRNSVARPITSEAFGQVAGLVELGVKTREILWPLLEQVG